MPSSRPGVLLRIHFSESDQYEGKPLYEAIVQRCRELQIAGATVFRGLEGFGGSAEIHRPRVFHHDQPIIVTVIDSEENIRRLVPAIEPMLDTGLLTLSPVTIRGRTTINN
jgi:uncharacterized protein